MNKLETEIPIAVREARSFLNTLRTVLRKFLEFQCRKLSQGIRQSQKTFSVLGSIEEQTGNPSGKEHDARVRAFGIYWGKIMFESLNSPLLSLEQLIHS